MPRSFAKPKPLFSTLVLGLMGSLLHFLYGWLGEWAPVGIIAAVNESVWEHTKLAFIPLLIYWLVLTFKLRKSHHWTNAAVAGLCSILMAIFLIPAAFYTIKYGLGIESLPLDIAIFFISILIAQFFGAYIFKRGNPGSIHTILSLLGMLAIFAFYIYATYYPPQLPIFISP